MIVVSNDTNQTCIAKYIDLRNTLDVKNNEISGRDFNFSDYHLFQENVTNSIKELGIVTNSKFHCRVKQDLTSSKLPENIILLDISGDINFTISNSGFLVCDLNHNLIGAVNESKNNNSERNLYDDYIVPEISKALVFIKDSNNNPVLDTEILMFPDKNGFIRKDNDYSILSIDNTVFLYPIHSVFKIRFVPIKNDKHYNG